MHVCVYICIYTQSTLVVPPIQIFQGSTEVGRRKKSPNGNANLLMRSLAEGKGPMGSGRCGHLYEDPRAKSPEEPQGDESSHL